MHTDSAESGNTRTRQNFKNFSQFERLPRSLFLMTIAPADGPNNADWFAHGVFDVREIMTRAGGGAGSIELLGSWSSGSEQNDFSGPIKHENGTMFLLTLEPEAIDEALELVMSEVRRLVRLYRVDVKEVHLIEIPADRLKFSV